MPNKKSRPFRDLLLERLSDPEVAKHYVREALDESKESFLTALRAVAQANQMSKVAKEANMQRESLYRSLSEQGNPNLDNLMGVLAAVGLKLSVEEIDKSVAATPQTPLIAHKNVEEQNISTPTTDNRLWSRIRNLTVKQEVKIGAIKVHHQEVEQGASSDQYMNEASMGGVIGSRAYFGGSVCLQQ